MRPLVALIFLLAGCAVSIAWFLRSGMDFRSFIFAKGSMLFISDIRPENNTKDIAISRQAMNLVASIAPGSVDMSLIDLGDGLAVYLFKPMNESKAAPDPRDPLLPVILWFHGGGFVEGSVVAESKNCQRIANTTGFFVVSVEYALAPENEFPAAVNDGMRALIWLFENAHFFGGDREKVFIGGESAGGNLAASTVIGHLIHDPPLNGQILGFLGVYPCLDHGSYTDSHFKYRHANGMLTLTQMQWYWALYLGAEQSSKEQSMRACPARAPSRIIRRFPPTFFILAEHDILYDEGVKFIKKLRDNHVQADYYSYPGTIHGFFGRRVFGPSGPNALLHACAELMKMLPNNNRLTHVNECEGNICTAKIKSKVQHDSL